MKNLLGTTLLAGLIALHATAQEAAKTEPPTPANSAKPVVEEAEDEGWAISLSAYQYFVPDDGDYFQPTVTFDYQWLHLEARYNYEDTQTASIWVGYNFSGGDELAWELTPMLGGAFGNTTGIAPGYKGSLSWWKLELYSESEYLFDTGDSSESFFYNWTELTLAPMDWFRFGVVMQRTRVYQTDRDIQRGLLVGFSFKRLDVSTYVFNPDDDPTVALGVSFGF